jgi:biopolymer transport protein ExbB
MKASKDQVNNYQKVIAIVSPMIGLLGTLCGVIAALTDPTQSGSNLGPVIGQCLVRTAVGIGLLVMATSGYFLCKNRVTRLAIDVHDIADDLLTQMYHNSKGKGLASSWN